MEAATKKKRGRPSVFVRDGMEEYKKLTLALYPNESPRTTANRHYETTGLQIFEEATIDHGELMFSKYPIGRGTVKSGIFEQVGRMYLQNGYSIEDCVTILQLSANALHEGATVKQIISYIRHGRITNEW